MLLRLGFCRSVLEAIASSPIAGSSGALIRFASSGTSDQRKATGLKELEKLSKASPTGRLLDLFEPGALSQPADGQPAQAKPAAIGKTAATKKRQSDASDTVQVMLKAMENCKPLIKVQSINTGSKIIHVPKPVTPNEQESMSVRWIVAAAHKRQETSAIPMAECLAIELLLAFRKEGAAREKRDELHRLALEHKNNVGGYRLR